MRLTHLVKALALAAVATLAVTGTAVAAKSHAVNSTGKVSAVASQGSKTIAVGWFNGAPFGADTVALFKTAVQAGKLKSTFVAYNSHGSIRGTATQTSTPQPDGSAKLAGTGKVLGGTGAYQGATGNLTVSGTQPKGSTVISYRLAGSLRY
ncbi:MAG: hypothetical protein M3155_03720 [Actinomycetota bacterium]|nr:hypothetical protein [Actinomycetota bacterium]